MAQLLARSEPGQPTDPRWREYHGRLVAFMISVYGLDRETARDLTQDVLLKVITSRPDGLAPAPWVYAVARNRLTDWFRSEGRSRDRRVPRFDEETLAARYIDPAEVLDQRDLRLRVGRYLDALPAREREVSFLRFFEGLRHRQIATATGLPVGTVKFIVHQIREGARSILEAPDDE
jgi:RNA polymerase sigma factor (sigma-70 family)